MMIYSRYVSSQQNITSHNNIKLQELKQFINNYITKHINYTIITNTTIK